MNTNIGSTGNARRGASWNTAPTKGARCERDDTEHGGIALGRAEAGPATDGLRAQTSCPSVTSGFSGLTRFTALAGGRADRRSRILAAG